VSQTPRLIRNDFFLLGHDESIGFEARTGARTLGIGLVAATLADLLRFRWVQLDDQYVVPRSGREVPDDLVMDDMLRHLRSTVEAPSINDLFALYGETAYKDAGDALVVLGTLFCQQRRWRPDRYRLRPGSNAVDLARAPAFYAVLNPHNTDVASAVLCGLLGATGLGSALHFNYTGDAKFLTMVNMIERHFCAPDLARVVEAAHQRIGRFALSAVLG
jgi:Golgi phosphoprotein 3 (GPP34)